VVQRFLWHAQHLNAEALNPFFITALLDMNASLILQDADDSYLCVTSLPDCWTIDQSSRPGDEAIFGEAIAGMLASAKCRARQSRQNETIEISLDENRVFEFRIVVFTVGEGHPQIITTIIDRSEERRREKVLQSLLRDVSHRSKNLLAIIQSIVTQTSQYTDSIDSYVQKLRGRIFSLSRSQDLVTDSGWRGAFVHDLLNQQISAYMPGGQELVAFEGDNILLSPNVSMHLGLAFHELLINAINFGTFLAAGDAISISCSIFEQDDTKHIRIDWNEPVNPRFQTISPEQQIPVRRLGTAILERVVPASVNGRAEYSISGLNVHYGLAFPADSASLI
jgi:two-component sensor histidine kinase